MSRASGAVASPTGIPLPSARARRRTVQFEELQALRAIHQLDGARPVDFSAWRQPPMPELLACIPNAGFDSLAHELFPYMASIEPLSSPKFGVSLQEQQAVARWTTRQGDRMPGVDDWIDLVAPLQADAAWRRQDVFIADGLGRPAIRLCEAGTAMRLLDRHRDRPASDCTDLPFALYEYVLINNLHPLLDGNGRLSRMVLNLRLRALHRRPDLYLPIKEACLHARAGYEISLRQVELQQRWSPFHHFMRELFQLILAIGRPAGSAR